MLLGSSIFAQSFGRHPFDAKNFNLGFLMGFNYNAYNLKEQINICDNGVCLKQISVVPKVGISLGMITNFNLSDQFSFRFIPSISLEQRDFNYEFIDNVEPMDSVAPILRKIEASYLNLPFLIQFKSKYWKRTRLYVLQGAQVSINMNSNKKVRDDLNLLKISPVDFSLVFGVGLNLYGDRIKLSPELRYSLGLINIYEPEFTSHANAIERLSTQVLTLIVNFE